MPSNSQIFMFLFLMLGPIKIIGPFAKITKNADAALTRKMAFMATLLSCIAILIAGFLGESMLSRYGIPIPILALAGGLIFFLMALQSIMEQFAPAISHEEEAVTPTLSMAMSPLAFPTIVTPYGIAAVIVFLSLCPDRNSQLIVIAMALGIMVLNLAVMLITRYIFKLLAVILPILGAVLGIVQVALGLMIIINQLKVIFHI